MRALRRAILMKANHVVSLHAHRLYSGRARSCKKDPCSNGDNPWFWSKNGHFSNFFLCNIGQLNVFCDILERKNAFLDYKNKKFKKSKNWDFSKRINPWFRSKNGHFSYFSLRNKSKEKVFYDILERKNSFLGYENKKFKKSKNWDFSKGVNPSFWSKKGHFSTFFFMQNRTAKCVSRYFRTKQRLSTL